MCLQTGALLARHTVVDTAQCVPAGVCVSLIRPCSPSCADSEDEMEWADAGLRLGGIVPAVFNPATARTYQQCAPWYVAESDKIGAIEAAAVALGAGGIPEAAVNFDEAVVGPFGAGFIWLHPGDGAWPATEDIPFPGGFQRTHSECDSEAGEFTKARSSASLDMLCAPLPSPASVFFLLDAGGVVG